MNTVPDARSTLGIWQTYPEVARELDVVQQVAAREPHHVPSVLEAGELVADLLARRLGLADRRLGRGLGLLGWCCGCGEYPV
jgi:hypothetical protein